MDQFYPISPRMKTYKDSAEPFLHTDSDIYLQLHKALIIKNSIRDSGFDSIQELLMFAPPEALDIMSNMGLSLSCLLALRRNDFTYCKPLVEV